MKTFQSIALVALVTFATCIPDEAHAAEVDLNMSPLFGSGANGGMWPWCSNGQSCNKVAYVSVKNLGGVATLAHLYIGTFDDNCPVDLSHVYTINCSTGGAITEVTSQLGDVSGVYGDIPPEMWPEGYKAPMRNIGGTGELCWRVDFGFESPPGHAGYQGCHYVIKVEPKSTDVDVDEFEYFNPYVHHGRSLTWEMD